MTTSETTPLLTTTKTAQAFVASSNMEDITKQLKLILCKLEGLETKLETVIETVSNLKTTVNKLENGVDKVQGDAKILRDGVYLGVKTCEVFLCFVAIVRVRAIMLSSLFSLFYVTGECHRFLHRG